MILAAQHIRERDEIITPFHERIVANGMTFGLGPAGYDVRIAETLTLEPGGFALASTIEHFDIPADLIAFVHDKSTWARLGLALQNTVAEPGWRGFLTLELTNHSAVPIQIRTGMPIAQIIFHELTGITTNPYPENGKYQDQAPGAQPAILELPGEYPCEHTLLLAAVASLEVEP